MKLNCSLRLLFVVVFVLSLTSVESPSAMAQAADHILHSFIPSGADGIQPMAGLIMDASDNLYGTTSEGGANGNGTVFELVNSSGTYSEKILHSFTNYDGAGPVAGLITDASGNLYGTTFSGGSQGGGVVFELVNSSGTYTERTLHNFGASGDGRSPLVGLLRDASGNLYGTTWLGGTNVGSCYNGLGCGSVFELVNSSGTYTEKILYSFTNSAGDGEYPYGSVVMDGSGNLFGTTQQGGANGYGIVFELVNSSGTYGENVLHAFNYGSGDAAVPEAGLLIDGSGNLYGTAIEGGTFGAGAVFELVNSSGTYTEQVIYSSGNSSGTGPAANVVMDASGNLYGTAQSGGTYGQGTVFELVNSSGAYSEKTLYSFKNSGGDGINPDASLVVDASRNIFGTTRNGGANSEGTVFELVDTTLSFVSTLNPSTYGQAVTFTATITTNFGAVSAAGGTVTWSANTGCGTTPVTSGTATCMTSVLPVGNDTVRADYAGTNNSGSGSTSQTVNAAATTINVTGVSPSSEVYGQDQPITITAVLSWTGSGAAATAANVTFSGNGNGTYGAINCGAPSSDTLTCTATYTPNANDADGTYTETATFSGDTNYSSSMSQQSDNFAIAAAGSGTIAITSSQNPSAFGQSVTFTATIPGEHGAIAKPKNKVMPKIVTGTVTWSANTGCRTTPVMSGIPGVTTCSTIILPVGSDTVTANYSGDSNHNLGSGAISQTVGLSASSINVTGVSPSSEVYGQDQPITITAVLSWTGSGALPTTANVTLSGNGNGLYGATSCGAPSSDTITCTATYIPDINDAVGTYTETATFSGDTNYSASASLQTNNFAISSTSSTTSVACVPDPSTYGQSTTCTATISGENGNVILRTRKNSVKPQIVTGTAAWSANTGCGTTNLTSGNPGTATCITSILAMGTDSVVVTYSADGNHGGSSGLVNQTVSQATTSISVTSVSPASENYGATTPVSITAVLSWAGGGTAPTAANVTIGGSGLSGSFGATSCGAPSGDTRTCTAAYTPNGNDQAGSYTISAAFSGAPNYSSSTSLQSNNFTIDASTSGAESFTLTPNISALTVQPGQTTNNTVILTVASTNGFVITSSGTPATTLPLTYSCTISPSAAEGPSCSFSPQNGQSISTTTPSVSMVTVASYAQLRQGSGKAIFLAVLLPGLFGTFLVTGFRWRGLRLIGLIVVLGFSTLGLSSCGVRDNELHSPQTNATKYIVTVNATTSGPSPIAASVSFALTTQ